jgi:hypothetical protein
MSKKIIISSALAGALALFSYYWGYLCGQRQAAFESYDHLLLNLTNNILIHDAMDSGKLEGVHPLVKAKLESDFARLVGLYEDYDFRQGEYGRCAISKRIRKMKEDGLIMSNEERLQDFPLQRVENYLNVECLGEPSHDNWMIGQ